MFALKKFVSQFIVPSTFSFLLLGLAASLYLLGRRRMAILIGALSFLALFVISLPITAYCLLKPLESSYLPFTVAGDDLDTVAVLGAHYSYKSGFTPGATINAIGQARLIEGYRLWRQAPETRRIITSGYAGSDQQNLPSYAQAAKSFLVDLGVPASKITAISEPRDTAEEAAVLLAELGPTSFILVTSASHMPRSMALMQAQGLKPMPAPTAYMALKQPALFKMPQAANLAAVDMAVHEYIGMLWGRLNGSILHWPWQLLAADE
jgi:uncharacterized SAM-binding protein YcdF (DUF218 family)